VCWPARVKAGQVINTPVHVNDWMPTLLAAAGLNSDEEEASAFAESKRSEESVDQANDSAKAETTLVDGMNLMPLLRGESIPARPLFWYLPLYDLRWCATPCAVIRDGDWKLIEHFGDWFDEQPQYHVGHRLELFNLSEDLGETHDLSSVQENIALKMQRRLHDWMTSIPVPIPAANPHFDPTRMLEETRQKQSWNR
jgi:arylsulfatase A